MVSLDTIYSVGEGRTVVVAVDGCGGCVAAFEEFLQTKQEPEDRVVAVVKGGRSKLPEGKISGPLVLGAKALARVAQTAHKARSPPRVTDATKDNASARKDCKLRNRVVVPGKPLSDFSDWDKAARGILAKLASSAEKYRTRFEAVRVAACRRPQHFAEEVMAVCVELDAHLLVIASHSSQKRATRGRSLSAVFSVNMSCPVLVLGRKGPCKEEEAETEAENAAFPAALGSSMFRSTSMSLQRKLSFSRLERMAKDDTDASLDPRRASLNFRTWSDTGRRSQSMSEGMEVGAARTAEEDVAPSTAPTASEPDRPTEHDGAAAAECASTAASGPSLQPAQGSAHDTAKGRESHEKGRSSSRGSSKASPKASDPERRIPHEVDRAGGKQAGAKKPRSPKRARAKAQLSRKQSAAGVSKEQPSKGGRPSVTRSRSAQGRMEGQHRRAELKRQQSLGEKVASACQRAVSLQKEAVINYFTP